MLAVCAAVQALLASGQCSLCPTPTPSSPHTSPALHPRPLEGACWDGCLIACWGAQAAPDLGLQLGTLLVPQATLLLGLGLGHRLAQHAMLQLGEGRGQKLRWQVTLRPQPQPHPVVLLQLLAQLGQWIWMLGLWLDQMECCSGWLKLCYLFTCPNNGGRACLSIDRWSCTRLPFMLSYVPHAPLHIVGIATLALLTSMAPSRHSGGA